MQILEQCISKNDLITEIFGEKLLSTDFDNLQNKVILSPKNIDCIKINEQILERMKGQSRLFESVGTLKSEYADDQGRFTDELIHSITPSGLHLHRLILKIGAIVMLLRNIWIQIYFLISITIE